VANAFRFLIIPSILVSQLVFAEASHLSRADQRRTEALSLVDKLSFTSQFQHELSTNKENPTQSLQLEYGGIPDTSGEKQKAIHIYRGEKGRPTGEIDLVAMQAGKARTLIAAKKACEKLVPLGQWRLATVPQVMAFFIELAPSFPLPQDPQKKGYLFWATSGDEVKDKANKETFLSAWEEAESKLETHEFSTFLTKVRTTIARAKSKEEKDYYIEMLKKTREGIPAVCVIGNEP